MNAEYRDLLNQLNSDREFVRKQHTLSNEEQEKNMNKLQRVKKRIDQNEQALVQLRTDLGMNSQYKGLIVQLNTDRDFVRNQHTLSAVEQEKNKKKLDSAEKRIDQNEPAFVQLRK